MYGESAVLLLKVAQLGFREVVVVLIVPAGDLKRFCFAEVKLVENYV